MFEISGNIWVVSRIQMMTARVSNKLLKDRGRGEEMGGWCVCGGVGSFKVTKAVCLSTDVSKQGGPSSSFFMETRNMPNLTRMGVNGRFHNVCCWFFSFLFFLQQRGPLGLFSLTDSVPLVPGSM